MEKTNIDEFCKKGVEYLIKEIYLEFDFLKLENNIEKLETETKDVLSNAENYVEVLRIKKDYKT